MIIQDVTNHKQIKVLKEQFGFSPSGTLKHYLINQRYLFIQQVDKQDPQTPFYYSLSDKQDGAPICGKLIAEVLKSDLVDQELIKTYGYKCSKAKSGVTYIIPNN